MGVTFAERIKKMKEEEDAARKKAAKEKKKAKQGIESVENAKFKNEMVKQFHELEFYIKSLELAGAKIDYEKLDNLNRKLFETRKKQGGKSQETKKIMEEIKKLIIDSRKT